MKILSTRVPHSVQNQQFSQKLKNFLSLIQIKPNLSSLFFTQITNLKFKNGSNPNAKPVFKKRALKHIIFRYFNVFRV